MKKQQKTNNSFEVSTKFILERCPSLPIYSQMIFVNLSFHTRYSGYAAVGVRKIAKELGINRNTVQKYIKILEKKNLIKRYGSRGQQAATITITRSRNKKYKSIDADIFPSNSLDIGILFGQRKK